mmetsp:Transcript_333/g.772  ORF Transcript_333/g.772 Transcript_333/m.772 type:complete len:133 (+) Transcript_333:1187-1585(+)
MNSPLDAAAVAAASMADWNSSECSVDSDAGVGDFAARLRFFGDGVTAAAFREDLALPASASIDLEFDNIRLAVDLVVTLDDMLVENAAAADEECLPNEDLARTKNASRDAVDDLMEVWGGTKAEWMMMMTIV